MVLGVEEGYLNTGTIQEQNQSAIHSCKSIYSLHAIFCSFT